MDSIFSNNLGNIKQDASKSTLYSEQIQNLEEHITDYSTSKSISKTTLTSNLTDEIITNKVLSGNYVTAQERANIMLNPSEQNLKLNGILNGTLSRESLGDSLFVPISDDNLMSIMNSSNIFGEQQIHDMRFNNFARYGMLDIYNQHTSSKEYLFFTKPDLHLFKTNTNSLSLNPEIAEIPFFSSMLKTNVESMLSLQQTWGFNNFSNQFPNGFDSRNKYMQVLSNHISSTLDLPTINATETQNNTNIYQVTTTYRDGSEASDFNFEFNLEFNDTKFLDVYNLFKTYDQYCREEMLRDITPTKMSYITELINSKDFSVWKIIVDDTNTILFYAKVTGVHPTGVPRDAMSNFEGPIKITVPFKGQFVSDMDPLCLYELNVNTAKSMGMTVTELNNMFRPITDNPEKEIDRRKRVSKYMIPLFDQSTNTPNTEWAGYPFIVSNATRPGQSSVEGTRYRLIWLRKR